MGTGPRLAPLAVQAFRFVLLWLIGRELVGEAGFYAIALWVRYLISAPVTLVLNFVLLSISHRRSYRELLLTSMLVAGGVPLLWYLKAMLDS